MRTLLRRLAPLTVIVAVLASGCSSLGEGPAATVNGQDISVDSVQQELDAIKGNKQYRAAAEQSFGSKLDGGGKGTFNSSFTAQVLSLRVYYTLLRQGLDKSGVKVTAADEKAALAAINQQLGPKVVKGFPAEYRRQLARQDALVNAASEDASSGTIGRRYFESNRKKFTQACVSHILISKEAHPDDAEAQFLAGSVKAELAAGADFAALAAQRSDDPGSKDLGGDLGCGVKGRFVPEFDAAVFSQPVGVVGEPVKTSFGYHLIVVKSRQPAKLADVKAQIGQDALNDYLLELTCGKRSNIDVNPRYGAWDRTPCKGDAGLAKVTAPAKPAVSGRGGRATVTTPSTLPTP